MVMAVRRGIVPAVRGMGMGMEMFRAVAVAVDVEVDAVAHHAAQDVGSEPYQHHTDRELQAACELGR